jgi:HEPN domain-containing protein
MNGSRDSIHPSDWIKIAEKDWQRMTIMMNAEDAEGSAYFLQQSLEKHIKAFLLEKGWKLKKTHELDALLDDAIQYKPNLGKYMELCERVSGYYFSQRYPALINSELTCEDIKKDIDEAERFINELKME